MKTLKYLSMAALALVGALMTSCSNSSDFEETPAQPQPASGDNVVTLTTTVSIASGETRALTDGGVKTFAEGEYMAVVYENTSGEMVRAVSEALTDGDITNTGKSATFTVTLTNPKADGHLKYIYPAAMSTNDGDINYSALNNQNGTLANISSYYDLGFYEGNFNGSNFPSDITLNNELAILVLNLKNDADGSVITNSITGLTVSDGTNTYNVTRSAGEGPIYVAIRPTTSATIEVTATDGTKTYAKALTGKTYEASNGYNFTWRMAEVIKGKFSVSSTKQVYFSKGNLQATTTDLGAHWTWNFAANQWDKVGQATANINVTGTDDPTVSANGTVDLFGWSTSKTYLGISHYDDNSKYSGTFDDWGSNDDVKASIGTGWYTLSGSEWTYLLNVSADGSRYRQGNRFAKAEVNGVRGLILLPDDWNTDYYTLKYINKSSLDVDKSGNDITIEDWTSKLEAHGAVFLPLAGQRRVDSHVVDNVNAQGYYWTSTPTSSDVSGYTGQAQRMYVAGTGVTPSVNSSRRFGYAVRLVRNVK